MPRQVFLRNTNPHQRDRKQIFVGHSHTGFGLGFFLGGPRRSILQRPLPGVVPGHNPNRQVIRLIVESCRQFSVIQEFQRALAQFAAGHGLYGVRCAPVDLHKDDEVLGSYGVINTCFPAADQSQADPQYLSGAQVPV